MAVLKRSIVEAHAALLVSVSRVIHRGIEIVFACLANRFFFRRARSLVRAAGDRALVDVLLRVEIFE